MGEVRYFRTWSLTIYDGSKIFGMESSKDGGRTWSDHGSGYKSEEQAIKHIGIVIAQHEDYRKREESDWLPALGQIERDTEWKFWHDR